MQSSSPGELSRPQPGPRFASVDLVHEDPPRPDETDDEIEHTAIGDEGHTAREEYLGLLVYVLSLAGFLTWLLRFGVNV